MNIEKLNGSQLFIVANILCRIAEETTKGTENIDDKDTKIAMKYVAFKLDEINKEVAEVIFEQMTKRMKELYKLINEE